MMDILEKIVEQKKIEVAGRKKELSLATLEGMIRDHPSPHRSLVQRLLEDGSTGIIAEFKRKSPSKGWFKPATQAVLPVAEAYDRFGAAGISVLTDETFFGGSLEDLRQVKREVSVPVLRKDFMIDRWQLAEAKAAGADVILLIAACLQPGEVKELAVYAHEIGLEVLLEIHNAAELGHSCDEVDMVGVNNRNLKTFEVDIRLSLDLVNDLPSGKPAVAESGISQVESILQLRAAGFKGFLIGENFMKSQDPAMAFREFVDLLEKKER